MISDNHNAYNNYNNYIDEYELTNGQNIIQLWMLFIRLTLTILLMLPTV